MAGSDDGIIHKGTALAVLDFHDPEVGIEADLLGAPGIGARFLAPAAQRLRPCQVPLGVAGLIEHQHLAVELGDFQDDGASLFHAAAHHKGRGARHLNPADQRAHEDAGFETGRRCHAALYQEAARNGRILASLTRWPLASTAAWGNRTVTMVPSPSTDCSIASPPCNCASDLTSASPRPVPSLARVCAFSTCSKGRPSRSRSD